MIVFTAGAIPDTLRTRLATVRADAVAEDVVAVGVDALRARIEDYVAHGFSKLVVVPVDQPVRGGDADSVRSWGDVLGDVAAATLDLQT